MSKLLFLLILLFSSPARAAWWIQDISANPPEEIKIHRNGQDLPARLLMPLQTGDVLRLPEGAALRVIQDDQTERGLTAQDSPFTVPDTAPTPTLWGNLLKSLHDWFSKKMAQPTIVVSATSRDGALALRGGPYLPPLQLRPGHARLRLYWQGGEPPYALRLDNAQGESVAKLDNIQDSLADFPLAGFTPGDYRLHLSDGDQSLPIDLRISQDLPKTASDIQQADLPASVRETYLALLLSADPAWRLEGLQRLHNLGLEKMIGRVIERGELPE